MCNQIYFSPVKVKEETIYAR